MLEELHLRCALNGKVLKGKDKGATLDSGNDMEKEWP